MKGKFFAYWGSFTNGLSARKIGLIMIGAMVCSFGIHNIHQRVGITEGGIMGLMLLIEHWLNISPAYITPVLDILCYFIAFKFLGGKIIKMSAIATVCISVFYKIWELFPPMLPNMTDYPLAAAISGGLFVGLGIGLIIRQGGSGSGDDALALTISKVTKWRLSRAYLFTDLVVLGLSLTYIPLTRIAYSLVTVTVSSCLIDFVQTFKKRNIEIQTS